jgi:hypothetical protein
MILVADVGGSTLFLANWLFHDVASGATAGSGGQPAGPAGDVRLCVGGQSAAGGLGGFADRSAGLSGAFRRLRHPADRFGAGLGRGCLERSPLAVARLGYRPSDLQIAQWIEQRFPEVQNRLSSGLAFVGQSEHDAAAGSAELRRAVVTQAVGDLEALDVGSCVDARPSWRTATMAGIVCLLALVLSALDPASSSLAARRLVMPWQSSPWPRRHQLVFVDPPERLAAGSDFEVELIDDRGELPETVQIHYWFEGTPEAETQSKSMSLFNDRMVHRMENVQRSFRYRASGGDDTSMTWRSLEVVETPQVEHLRLQLHPPAYTGWPIEAAARMWSHSKERNRRVRTDGQTGCRRRITSCRRPATRRKRPGWRRWAMTDLTFALPVDCPTPWTAEASGRYWFEVTDLQGLRGRGDRPWSLRVVPDAAPVVALEKPGANTYVTASAIVPVKATVKDDLAIRAIDVRYRRGDQARTTNNRGKCTEAPMHRPLWQAACGHPASAAKRSPSTSSGIFRQSPI